LPFRRLSKDSVARVVHRRRPRCRCRATHRSRSQEQRRPADVPGARPLSEFSAPMPHPSTALQVLRVAWTCSTPAQGSSSGLG